MTAIAIRRAEGRDVAGLRRLAELDSAPVPAGEHLVAEEDGALRAALPLEGGPPIADPFHRTAELVALLELRFVQIRGSPASRDVGRGARERRRLPRRLSFAATLARR